MRTAGAGVIGIGNLPDYLRYHDQEWGRPVTDDIRLFEKICLEGFQSGLSWLTIPRKRENFRAAFAGFDFEKVALFTDEDIERCVADAGIIRHRCKIVSTINNARRAIELRDEFARWRTISELRARSQRTPQGGRPRHHHGQSDDVDLGRDLQEFEEARLGFFVGLTTIYASGRRQWVSSTIIWRAATAA